MNRSWTHYAPLHYIQPAAASPRPPTAATSTSNSPIPIRGISQPRKLSDTSLSHSSTSSAPSKRPIEFVDLISSDEDDDNVPITPKRYRTTPPEPTPALHRNENDTREDEEGSDGDSDQTSEEEIGGDDEDDQHQTPRSLQSHYPSPSAIRFRAVEVPVRKPYVVIPKTPAAIAQREQFEKNLRELKGPKVTVVNEIDESSPSINFRFVQKSILRPGVKHVTEDFMVGCDCYKDNGRKIGCEYLYCECLQDSQLNDDGKRVFPYAAGTLRKGEFIDTYRGEIITVKEANDRADKRSTDEAVYFMNFDKFCEAEAITKTEFLEDFPDKVEEHHKKVADGDWEIYMKNGEEMWLNPNYVPYEYVCDGMYVGGPTRFMNHSCDPNCRLFTVSYNHSDTNLYDLAFFTHEEIPAGIELTFDYKDEDDRSIITDEEAWQKQKRDGYMPQKCLCGTAECRRYFFN
ncbi:MAG: hypothetical protein Q9209_006520 [Squamulea sp. 1 TL-2023]